MEIRGFTKEGSWHKGNLHSHTTNSDGLLSPKQVAKLYRKRGYSFICLSDHDLYTDYRSELNKSDFKILPGFEASAILFEDETLKKSLKAHHMNAILGTTAMQEQAPVKRPEHGTPLPVRHYFGSWDGAAVAQEMVNDLSNMGFIVSYNHPVWSRVRPEEFAYTENLFAMELFNYNGVNESGTGFDTHSWDTLLRDGGRLLGIATDDNHNWGTFNDTFGGWISVKMTNLSHDEIISNMMSGNFNSSMGPEIYDWGVSDDTVYIECSKVNRINFIVGSALGDGATVLSKTLKEKIQGADYKLKGHESYVRVECVDKRGCIAWTNPIYLK